MFHCLSHFTKLPAVKKMGLTSSKLRYLPLRVWRLSVMNMFYYKWLRFQQYSVVYNKQLKLTVPTVHCFSVSRHVQCIRLAQLLLNTILYLCLKMSESAKNLCERGEWNEQWKWYQCPARAIKSGYTQIKNCGKRGVKISIQTVASRI